MPDFCSRHDWNAKHNIRLVIEQPQDAVQFMIYSPPPMIPIHFCRMCGAIRLSPGFIEQARKLEATKAENEIL